MVTGGGTGIGPAIAARARRGEGAGDVTGSARRRSGAGSALGRAVGRRDVDRRARRSTPPSPRARPKRHGPIAILVNNAGARARAPFVKAPSELWRDDAGGQSRRRVPCCAGGAAGHARCRAGRIVNIACTAGLKGYRLCRALCRRQAWRARPDARARRRTWRRPRSPSTRSARLHRHRHRRARRSPTIAAKTGRSEAEARASSPAQSAAAG